MMDTRLWAVLACIAAGCVVAVVWWSRRSRRVFNIDHIRVELHDAHIVDDRVIDAVWRAAISMTNKTRRPRVLPVLAARATVTARHRVYLADVFLESGATELNPEDVALAWVEFTLPSGVLPRRGEVTRLRDPRPARSFRFARVRAGLPATSERFIGA